LSQEADPDVLGVPQQHRDQRRRRPAIQLDSFSEASDRKRRLGGRLGQCGAEPNCDRSAAHRKPLVRTHQPAGVDCHVGVHHHAQ
ncbi:hypothetical protein HDU91_004263, partial [Kappamyces sp. JEL0680]